MHDINWTSYAQVYDLLAIYNPAYRQIVKGFQEEIRGWVIGPQEDLLEVGSGTGNFTLTLADTFKRSQVVCVDSDPRMNSAMKRKARAMGLKNVKVIEKAAETVDFSSRRFSAVVCVHALYTLAQPSRMIRRMFEWTKPGGYVFACDLGRTLNIFDWSTYLFKEISKRYGVRRALSTFYQGRDVLSQNRLIAKAQRTDRFWTHSTSEFEKAFRCAGFRIIRSFRTYRGYSDVVICQRARG